MEEGFPINESVALEVSNLTVQSKSKKGTVNLIEDLHFTIKRGKILGLVGESGCGKTITSMSILRLLDATTTRSTGSVRVDGKELMNLNEAELRKIRGKNIAFIMQNPMSAFTPVFTIGHQFTETICAHARCNKKEAVQIAIEAMQHVNLPDPKILLKSYPFQLSGGMLQRVMIALAACLHPAVIIADEPTTALDVSNQKNVLFYLEKIRATYGTAILLISHDLGVIAEMADEVMVMKNGRIIEHAEVFELFDHPQHDYTKSLLRRQSSLKIEQEALSLV